MTVPLPPELQAIRAELAVAARTRARRGVRRRRRLRLTGLGAGMFLTIGSIATATGVVPNALDVVKGDARTVRLLGGPQDGTYVRCGPYQAGDDLCRIDRRGLGVDTFEGLLWERGATGGTIESADSCRDFRCTQVRRPDPDAVPDRSGTVATYRRMSVRLPTHAADRDRRFRQQGTSVVRISVDGAPAVSCGPAPNDPGVVCGTFRAEGRRRPVDLGRVPRRLDARVVVFETAIRCRLGRDYVCRALEAGAGRRLSDQPQRLQPGTTVEYVRTVAVR